MCFLTIRERPQKHEEDQRLTFGFVDSNEKATKPFWTTKKNSKVEVCKCIKIIAMVQQWNGVRQHWCEALLVFYLLSIRGHLCKNKRHDSEYF